MGDRIPPDPQQSPITDGEALGWLDPSPFDDERVRHLASQPELWKLEIDEHELSDLDIPESMVPRLLRRAVVGLGVFVASFTLSFTFNHDHGDVQAEAPSGLILPPSINGEVYPVQSEFEQELYRISDEEIAQVEPLELFIELGGDYFDPFRTGYFGDRLKPYHEMDPAAASSMFAITYDVLYEDGAEDKGFVGRASIIERDGQLALMTIDHVVDDNLVNSYLNPVDSTENTLGMFIPGLGVIELTTAGQKARMDINTSIPDFLEPNEMRGDPNVLVPLSREVQLLLRRLQFEGRFTPLQIAQSQPEYGELLYIASHFTGELVEFRLAGTSGEYVASDERSMAGLYAIHASVQNQEAIDDYLQNKYKISLIEAIDDPDLVKLSSSEDTTVVDVMICSGFSGGAVMRSVDGEMRVVGLLSTVASQFLDLDDRYCSIYAQVEPI